MFDFVRSNTRVLFFILLVLIIPSFVLVGVDGYRQSDQASRQSVAEVNGSEISQAEWDSVHRMQAEQLLRQDPSRDPKQLDSPEIKYQVLEAMVRQRVTAAAVEKLDLVTSDETLKRFFSTAPQFASIRNPDGSIDKERLALQGMTPVMFDQRLRQELATQQVFRGITDSVFASSTVASRSLDSLMQQREVQILSFSSDKHLPSVKPTDEQIEVYYRDPLKASRFKSPEYADVEYVVLDLETMKKSVVFSEDDLKKYYEQNAPRFTTPEEVRASHVLIKVDKDAPAEERAKAKAKAEALLAELRAKPSSFAEVARKNSDDSGSAQSGGDLDFFGRGLMVKPFDQAVFSMKNIGDVSDVVTTDYGFHIIQLTGRRGGEKQSFDTVRATLENEVREQLAQRKFAEAAVDFSNIVYEQADSLKPAAEKFKLEIQSAQKISRGLLAERDSVFSPRFLELLFSSDSVQNKRNTEALDLGQNRLVAGRITKYSPERQPPLDEVRDAVREAVALEQAAAAARQEGQTKLATLKDAPNTELTEPAQKISRLSAGMIPLEVVEAVLGAPTDTLPSVIGVDLGDRGYAVVKLLKVMPRDESPDSVSRSRATYERVWADAEARAYYAALQKRFKTKINAKSPRADTRPPI